MPVTATAESRPHVLRPPLPWRPADRTECGLDAGQRQYITRDEFRRMLQRDGQKRTIYAVCATCFESAGRWPTWDEDPVRAVAREFYNPYTHHPRLPHELRAIAAIVARHNDEFTQMVEALDGIPNLQQIRSSRRARTARPRHGA